MHINALNQLCMIGIIYARLEFSIKVPVSNSIGLILCVLNTQRNLVYQIIKLNRARGRLQTVSSVISSLAIIINLSCQRRLHDYRIT